jgi:hypothetical protein
MKKYYMIFLFCCLILNVAAEKITVYRNGNNLFVQSRWSQEKDIVIHVCRIANEISYLVPHGSDIRQYKKGIRLHTGLDDYPATLFAGGQGYGYLSGNHGSAFGTILTLSEKSFSEKDTGTALYDEAKNCYRIVQVIASDKILIHPESRTGILGRPKFPRLGKNKLFRSGTELQYIKSRSVQVYPMNRISRLEFLIDGRDYLPDKTVIQCNFLDHIFEHDVIAPEGMLEYLKQHQGRRPYPEFTACWNMVQMSSDPRLKEYGTLPALATFRNKYRYQQNGAVVNYRSSTFHVSFPNVSQMEQMFTWGGGKIASGKLDEFYIPKLNLVQLKIQNAKDKTENYDFSKVAAMPAKMKVMHTLLKTDAVNPVDLPDRFIRLSGNGKREYGLALGYSLFAGCTAKNKQPQNRSSLYFFYPTKKMYPYAYILTNNKPGITVRSVSYKQYFDPATEPDATAFYYHQQKKSDVVYFDCHKPLKNKRLKLPARMIGKKISILEKTPSIKFHAQPDRLSADDLRFDVDASQGSFVLKLD